MFVAQVPQSTPLQIGEWLIPFAAIVGIAVVIMRGVNEYKQMTAKPPDPPPKPEKPRRDRADRFVKRSDLDAMNTEVKAEYVRIGSLVQKLEDYTQRRLHELSDIVHAVGLKQASQPNEMRRMIDAAVQPMNGKIDQLVVVVAAVAAKMNIHPGIYPQPVVPPPMPHEGHMS